MMDEVEVSATGFLKRDDELTTALARWHGASAKNFQNMDCVDSIDKLSENSLLLMVSELQNLKESINNSIGYGIVS